MRRSRETERGGGRERDRKRAVSRLPNDDDDDDEEEEEEEEEDAAADDEEEAK